jgi:hypothetical protein
MQRIDLGAGWYIVCASSHPVASLAAVELAEVLRRITGRHFAIVGERSGSALSIVLSHGDGAGDGFRWQVTARQVDLQGDSPRGLLYAAYSWLEALGCRWVAPGPDGERLPQGVHLDLSADAVRESPLLPGRCLIVGHAAFMQDVEDWIVWAARNRLNTLFVHVTAEPLALGAAPESQWQAQKGVAVTLARRRGMTIEHGGHGLSALLPRRLFRQVPGAFRYHGGRRTPDRNFCPSSPEGLAVIRRNAQAHFRAHPEVDVFHLWPDDIPGGGWCACESCRRYTPSEQALLAINAVAEALEEVDPHAQVAFLAYMDTEKVPLQVQPRHNVCLSWAPRRRCYAHGTDDPACSVNVPHYAATFRAQTEHFRAAGSQPPRVFEYYLDALLFKSLLPPLPAVMQRDLIFYRDAGAHTVQALMTGDRPWLTPQLNAWLFARLSWDPAQDLDVLLADFGCAALGRPAPGILGPDAHHYSAYYRALEAAFALALDIVPRQVQIDFGFNFARLMDHPIADMGDPALAPPEVLRRKSQDNAAIPGLLADAARHLEAVRPGASPEAWAAERAALDLARAWLHFDLNRVRLYEAVSSMLPAPELGRRLEEAQSALDDVLAWAGAHVADPRFRLNYRTVHLLFWQVRLIQIRADYLLGACGRRLIKIWALLRVLWSLLRLRGIYAA